MGDTPMTEADETTYLGVTFDKRQTWKPHIVKKERKARRKLAMMRKLAGTTWGANEHILKTVYRGTVRPQLEYSSPTWSTTAKSNRQALDKIQNQALRIITGATKSTPIAFMEKITGIQPLQERRDVKILLQTEKYTCLTDHPMSARVKGYTKNRIKRSHFVHGAKKLDKAYATDLTIPTTPFGSEDIPGKQEDDQYPREAWTPVYTDGSATRAVTNGGAGIVILYPSGKRETHHAATGTHCSNYRAETEALMKAVSMIEDSTEAVFLTDAMSVLEALTNNKIPQLANALQRISTNLNVTLQWSG
ncbi:uncharacterized protein LOC127832237 [Dreissena polymorpha]|uniref:uncharacterized protein LOC127832237 n=1 Tax=Dreissena polymorpha TaxID=45954 RepID=UPI0022653756|nr:uncharacterized protein LOC127832237 [Dreissena polymorpha]